MSDLRECIESTNQQREITQFIEDYAVLEQLGAGAFGVVCKVRKRDSSHNYYALKEVYKNHTFRNSVNACCEILSIVAISFIYCVLSFFAALIGVSKCCGAIFR